ncbi:hypothetical protein D3C87_1453930 [compost metagenome]
MGSGKRPRVSTSLELSAITIMASEAAATIFSRRSAPPPPLIRFSAASISSAPSTVTSSRSRASRSESGMPQSRAWRAVASEVGTPTISSPCATRSPNRSTKWRAVEPVPSPTFIPDDISATARAAASRLRASLMAPLLMQLAGV